MLKKAGPNRVPWGTPLFTDCVLSVKKAWTPSITSLVNSWHSSFSFSLRWGTFSSILASSSRKVDFNLFHNKLSNVIISMKQICIDWPAFSKAVFVVGQKVFVCQVIYDSIIYHAFHNFRGDRGQTDRSLVFGLYTLSIRIYSVVNFTLGMGVVTCLGGRFGGSP